MATATLPSFIESIRGRLGDHVYRHCHGRTIVYPYRRPPARPPTERQAASRMQFTLAVDYAKGALQHADARAAYEQAAREQNKPLFAVATGDFRKPPVVERIGLARYRGRRGDPIVICATDDVGVVAVHVTIRARTGELIETGAARRLKKSWVYTAMKNLRVRQAVSVEAVAKDRAGNEARVTSDK